MGLGCITRSCYGNAKSVFARGSQQPDSRLRNILFLRALIQVLGGFHGVLLVLECFHAFLERAVVFFHGVHLVSQSLECLRCFDLLVQ